MQFFLVCIAATLALADDWSYPHLAANGELNDPENWGGQCDSGSRQSPIDLAFGASVRGTFEEFQFHNYDQPIKDAKVTNNGHSIQINVVQPSTVMMEGGGLPQKYVLDQMHFHWGSEHTIDGRRYPLELHMVHHDARFATLNDALASKTGVAVVGVLFHGSTKDNEALENILNGVKEVAEVTSKSATIPKILRPDALLPTNTSMFFRYDGSLTTPTCAESVVWTVFTSSVPISFDQVEYFKQVKNSHGEAMTHNFRSLQPLNSRTLIYAAPIIELGSYDGAGVSVKPCVALFVVLMGSRLLRWLFN